MSNNILQRQNLDWADEANEAAARQAAMNARVTALPLRLQSPGPNRQPDPAPAPADAPIGIDDDNMPAEGGAEAPTMPGADVQMSMDNNDIPAQGGAQNPAPGAEERAQDGAPAPEVPHAEGHGHQRGQLQPRGQNRRRGPGDRRTARTQAYWNRGRPRGHRGHRGSNRGNNRGSYHGAPIQTYSAGNINVFHITNAADAAAIAQLLGGPPRGGQNRGRGSWTGGRGQQ
jgi:hypothetical protein